MRFIYNLIKMSDKAMLKKQASRNFIAIRAMLHNEAIYQHDLVDLT